MHQVRFREAILSWRKFKSVILVKSRLKHHYFATFRFYLPQVKQPLYQNKNLNWQKKCTDLICPVLPKSENGQRIENSELFPVLLVSLVFQLPFSRGKLTTFLLKLDDF